MSSTKVAQKGAQPVKQNTNHNDGIKEPTKWYASYAVTTVSPPPTVDEMTKYLASVDFKNFVRDIRQRKVVIDPITEPQLRQIGIKTLDTLAEKEANTPFVKKSKTWVHKMLTSGTAGDKVSALSAQIKAQPMGCFSYLDSLLAIASKKGNKDTNLAIEALRDLFTVDLLPSHRRLVYFSQQPWIIALVSHTTNPTQSSLPLTHPYTEMPRADMLAYMVLEDGLKARYQRFIEILEDGSHTTLAYTKRHRLGIVYDLLNGIPEQETVLLGILCNKFGDSERAIASHVTSLLTKLVQKHPGMKLAIVKEIERIIFRPHIKQRAQYFALIYLSSIILTQNEHILAQALIALYLSVFQVTIHDAIPTIKDRQILAQSFLTSKAHIIKHGKGKTAEKARKKAKRLTKHTDQGVSTKILGVLLTGVTRAVPYAISTDNPAEKEILIAALSDHMEQLYQVAVSTMALDNGSVGVQALALAWQVLELTPQLSRDAFYKHLYTVLLSPAPFTCSRVKGFLNTLHKAIKSDTSETRSLAMIKRALQTVYPLGIPHIASILYVIGVLIQQKVEFKRAILKRDQPSEQIKTDIIPLDQYNAMSEKEKESFISATPITVDNIKGMKVERKRFYTYDPFEADPLYTRAETSGLWELTMALHSYHPTLALWSKHLITTTKPINYGGDPLADFTVIKFLEGWIRKQPKKEGPHKYKSVHQPPKLASTYNAALANDFMSLFSPRASPEVVKLKKETAEQFAERVIEQELLKISSGGKADLEGDLKEFAKKARGRSEDDDDNEEDSLGISDDDDDEDDYEEIGPDEMVSLMDEDYDDDEDDEPVEFNQDGYATHTARGVFDDDSDDDDGDDQPPSSSKKHKKAKKQSTESPSELSLDSIDLSDLSDVEFSEDDDDDNEKTFAEMFQNDDVVAEMLEDATSLPTKNQEHREKLFTEGYSKASKKKSDGSENKNTKQPKGKGPQSNKGGNNKHSGGGKPAKRQRTK